MALVLPNNVKVAHLNYELDRALTLRLYRNIVTLDGTISYASFTECDALGYAAILLDFDNWVITEAAPSIALYDSFQAFNFTGTGNTIKGYYVTEGVQLRWAEAFSQVFTPSDGAVIRITPRFAAA